MRKTTQEDFERRVREAQGDRLDLSAAVYVKSSSHVTVTCRACGASFLSTPDNLYRGKGCRACADQELSRSRRLTIGEVERRLSALHPLTFPNVSEEYKGNSSPITLMCQVHGQRQVTASKLFAGAGCPTCGEENHPARQPNTTAEFIEKSRVRYGEAFDYTSTNYLGSSLPVTLRCVEHNLKFSVQPSVHLRERGRGGCPECASRFRNANRALTPEQLLARFRELHGDTYAEYDLSNYTRQKDRIRILCRDHGWFEQSVDNHLRGCGCSECGRFFTYLAAGYGSHGQTQLNNFISSLLPTVENWNIPTQRGKPKQIDVFVPSKQIGFEYNGLYYHSMATNKGSDFHTSKQREAARLGVRVIHIFEDEWVNRRKACELAIAHILGVSQRSGARSFTATVGDETDVFAFYDRYHLQGRPRPGGTHFVLANPSGEIVSAMTFVHRLSRRGSNRDESRVELIRFCSTHAIAGAASRLFSLFTAANPNTDKIVSYSDNRWFDGGMYERLGFSLSHTTSPNYKYIKVGVLHRYTKSLFQRSKLPEMFKEGFDPSKTEWENCEANGYYRIYDCGVKCWVWSRP